jgi:hypothetical protein
MGSTKFEGGLLQKCLQVKVQKLPQTKDYNYTKELQVLQCLHNLQRYKDTKDTTRCK